MSRKLHEKPNSLEELTEKRDRMKQIPEQLKSYKVHRHGQAISVMCHMEGCFFNKSDFLICEQQELIGKTLSDYELIEELCYCLSDDDVNTK